MRGAVSSGHPLTTEAAIEMLRKGGNAFDAAVAAGFASVVTEPTLSSLGGGGFLLAHLSDSKDTVVYDFFVNAPGKGAPEGTVPRMIPVQLEFKATVQKFYIGMGSVAVPGVLKGLVRIYDDLCSMEIKDLIVPTLRYLEEGVPLTEKLLYQIEILKPILNLTEYGREIFDTYRTDRLYNPLLKEFLSLCSPQAWIDEFYIKGGRRLAEEMSKEGGILTFKDMEDYEVQIHYPLECNYRGYRILTNPPPSLGGRLICMALDYLGQFHMTSLSPSDRQILRCSAMKEMNRYKASKTGTTHISIIDGKGNAVSMTLSNGTGSGCFLPDTGIMLNNMMGEEDLHPEGFFKTPPGQRVASMMSPTFIKKNRRIHTVLGSGGSKRIRTAILQVILNLIDEGMSVRDAVEAPRLHLDDEGVVQIEPGLDDKTVAALSKIYRVNLWESKDLYFGGVNTVMGNYTGWGDSRRGGHFMSI
jgi:gamma-glutamyltranspeptidase/glutathione hydrolase